MKTENMLKPIRNNRNNGAVLLIVVFIISLLTVLVIGILQLNTEEIQLMQNHIFASQALATAEAGLNDAMAEIRADSSWTTGFNNKSFNGGSYTTTVSGSLPSRTILSTGTTAQGFVARLEADVTIGTSSPYSISIDQLRINE